MTKTMHKVVIRPITGNRYYIKIDGNEMLAKSVDLHMDTDSVPAVDIELVGEPDIDVEGLVTFEFTPKTIIGASNVLKAALMKKSLEAFISLDSINRAVANVRAD